MTTTPSDPPRPLPRWLILGGSLALGFHLFAIGILVLAAPSGPWQTQFGPSMALAPQFAGAINQVTTGYYLEPLALTHNYHLATNRTGLPAVYFEVRLFDAKGNQVKTVTVPDKRANFWVRHRQELLAQGLADDQPVQPPRGEVIAAPGEKLKEQIFFHMAEPNQTVLGLY